MYQSTQRLSIAITSVVLFVGYAAKCLDLGIILI
jgi:hypothetical protein